ncbi:hypothetical protein C8F01DRAFT_1263328 [Mycena amicta]|nr:hypothetical protein C8F01DRAFT_1263328 [Mycena amicta]
MEGDGNGKRPCLSLLTTTPLASTSSAPLSATTASTRSPRSPSPPAAILPPGCTCPARYASASRCSLNLFLFLFPGSQYRATHCRRIHGIRRVCSLRLGRLGSLLLLLRPHPHQRQRQRLIDTPHAPVKSVAPSRWRWHSILPPLDTGFDFRGQLTSASARGSPVDSVIEVEEEQEQEQGGESDVMVEVVRHETPTELVQPAGEYGGAVAYEQGCWSQSQTGASGYQMTQTQWYHGHSTYQQHQPEPAYHSPVSASSPTTIASNVPVSADQHEQPTYNTHYNSSQAFRYPRAYSPVPALAPAPPVPAPADSQPQPQPQPHFITQRPTPLSPREASGVTRSLPHAHVPHHHPYGYARGLPMTMSRQPPQDAEGMGSQSRQLQQPEVVPMPMPMYAPSPVRPDGYSIPVPEEVDCDSEPLPPPPPPPPMAQNDDRVHYHHPAAAYDEYAYYAQQQEQEHVDTPPSTSSSSGSSVASSETESPQTPYVYPAYAQAQRYPLAFAQQQADYDGPEAEEAQASHAFYATGQAYYNTDPNAECSPKNPMTLAKRGAISTVVWFNLNQAYCSPMSPSYEYGHGYTYPGGGYGYGCGYAEEKQYEPRQVQLQYQRHPHPHAPPPAESELYLAQQQQYGGWRVGVDGQVS